LLLAGALCVAQAQRIPNPEASRTAFSKISPDLLEQPTVGTLARQADEPVRVIIQLREDEEGKRPAKWNAQWGQLVEETENMPFLFANVRRSQLAKLAADPNVIYLAPDREVSASHFPPYMYREAIGYRFAAMAVPENPVETGTGVGVAIIDSGVSADDYLKTAPGCTASRIVYSQNFVSGTGESTTNDLYGHGTHVAGIAAGTGLCLPGTDKLFNGIAPGASIINLRVLNSRGSGTDSAVIAAIDRAIAIRATYKIKVINLSLGRMIRESFTTDPLCLAVERAWKAGITVVVAAGNNGRDNSMGTNGYSTITSPANSPYVITVGATRMVGHTGREDDTVTSYSSKGPTLRDRVVKPDLVAPGNVMYARLTPSQYLVQSYAANTLRFYVYSTAEIPNVFLLSGTSMASPVVAGSAALLLQKDPTLTPNQIKARLMKTAWKPFVPTASITDTQTNQTFNIQHDLFTVGAGHLDLKAALASTEKATSSKLALSPRVTRVNGQVKFVTTYPNIYNGTNVVWGDNVLWGGNVVWGSNVVWGDNVLWGSNVVWGSTTAAANNVVWGDNVLWGSANPFAEALAIRGDR